MKLNYFPEIFNKSFFTKMLEHLAQENIQDKLLFPDTFSQTEY